MKKKLLIAVPIILVVIVCAVVACIALFNQKDEEETGPYDIVLKSQDKKVNYTLKEKSPNEIENSQPGVYICKIPDLTLSKLLDKDFKDEIVYLDDNYKISENETNKCYVYVDKHYFYFEINDEWLQNLSYYELISEFCPTDGNGGSMISPFYSTDNITLAWAEENKFTWSDTIGLSSFDDLVNFYKTIDSSYYSIDEENQIITLNLFYSGGELSGDKAQVKVDGDNITVKFISDEDNKEN